MEEYLERFPTDQLYFMCSQPKMKEYRKICDKILESRDLTPMDQLSRYKPESLYVILDSFPDYDSALAFAEAIYPDFKNLPQHRFLQDKFTTFEEEDTFDGKIKRTIIGDKKQEIKTRPDGIIEEKWYSLINGTWVLDRDIGPAFISTYPRTHEVEKQWYRYGRQYRANNEPYYQMYINNQLREEYNDKYQIHYREDGTKDYKIFFNKHGNRIKTEHYDDQGKKVIRLELL